MPWPRDCQSLVHLRFAPLIKINYQSVSVTRPWLGKILSSDIRQMKWHAANNVKVGWKLQQRREQPRKVLSKTSTGTWLPLRYRKWTVLEFRLSLEEPCPVTEESFVSQLTWKFFTWHFCTICHTHGTICVRNSSNFTSTPVRKTVTKKT